MTESLKESQLKRIDRTNRACASGDASRHLIALDLLAIST
jgi:hypothetical protein